MKRHMLKLSVGMMMALGSYAWASDAETSATAGSNRFSRNGNASATARYEGDVGFANTQSRSGRVNTARGVAVGFDENGLSLSVSNAVASRNGLGVATNFNLSIGRDGSVSHSGGSAVTAGGLRQDVSAGGSAGSHRGGSTATSFARGDTGRFGTSRAHVYSHSQRGERRVVRPVRVVRVIRR
jgi:hypothetical protein